MKTLILLLLLTGCGQAVEEKTLAPCATESTCTQGNVCVCKVTTYLSGECFTTCADKVDE